METSLPLDSVARFLLMALSAQVEALERRAAGRGPTPGRGHCGVLGPAPAALAAALVAAELCVWLAAAAADGRQSRLRESAGRTSPWAQGADETRLSSVRSLRCRLENSSFKLSSLRSSSWKRAGCLEAGASERR